jgi:hypothetical protein
VCVAREWTWSWWERGGVASTRVCARACVPCAALLACTRSLYCLNALPIVLGGGDTTAAAAAASASAAAAVGLLQEPGEEVRRPFEHGLLEDLDLVVQDNIPEHGGIIMATVRMTRVEQAAHGEATHRPWHPTPPPPRARVDTPPVTRTSACVIASFTMHGGPTVPAGWQCGVVTGAADACTAHAQSPEDSGRCSLRDRGCVLRTPVCTRVSFPCMCPWCTQAFEP